MNITHFADGEFAVSYEESIRGAHVFLVQSTFPNSDNLMELLLMIDAAKRSCVCWRKHFVSVIVPFFGWARQDRKDKPRVSIGAKLVADLLSVAGLSVVVIVRGWKTFSVFICLAWIIGCLRTIAAHRVLLWRTPSVWEMRSISIIKNFLLKSEVMSTEEEYKELSAKLRYGLELAEQRLIEETARREGTLCYGRPDGKVVRISATELLKLRQSGGNNAASVAVCTCSEMESGWNR